MEETKRKFKLFISYSHHDEKHIEQFVKHIAPLKTNGLIQDWYDRKILPGKPFQVQLDHKLEDADIICLCVSASFLSSDACMGEKENAIHYMKRKGTVIVPIILSPCGWLDDKELSKLMALPSDGTPITTFANSDAAWNQVYKELKRLTVAESNIENLQISDQFQNFLNSTGLLSRAHSQKEEVSLEDIFIYPDLSKFDALNE